jgi:hypothetical protein
MTFKNRKDDSNPYAPVTKAEKVAAKKHLRAAWWSDVSITSRDAFAEGLRQNPANSGVEFSAEDIQRLWVEFVDADLKLPRGYPDGSDVFMAGYRTNVQVPV